MSERTNGHNGSGARRESRLRQPGSRRLDGPVELPLSKADFSSDQETRWCPGCGDYAILASVQSLMPELGIPPEKIVFVTGIGCAGRFVYYMDTYGMHGIHGRAPALATGVATSQTGPVGVGGERDGDALSIGGNHLIHALRRNVPLKILLFNNQIYGLTKGQYSPTSEEGKVTKSTPFGSQDHPFNPVSLALGAEASFVARTVDTDKKHVAETLRAAAAHQGTAFVEIYQNCNVFNDGAFDAVRAKGEKEHNQIRLEHGQPIRFGVEGERGVVRGAGGRLELVDVATVGEDALVVHDAQRAEPSLAFELAHLAARPTGPTPIGIFRSVERPVYGAELSAALEEARAGVGTSELEALLHSGDTWTVSWPGQGSNEGRPGPPTRPTLDVFRGGLDFRAQRVETGPTSCPGHRAGRIRPRGGLKGCLCPRKARVGRVVHPSPAPGPALVAAVSRSGGQFGDDFGDAGAGVLLIEMLRQPLEDLVGRHVVARHRRGEAADAAAAGHAGEARGEEGADAASLPVVHDNDGHLGGLGVVGPANEAADRDQAANWLARILGYQCHVIAAVHLSEVSQLCPAEAALGGEEAPVHALIGELP